MEDYVNLRKGEGMWYNGVDEIGKLGFDERFTVGRGHDPRRRSIEIGVAGCI